MWLYRSEKVQIDPIHYKSILITTNRSEPLQIDPKNYKSIRKTTNRSDPVQIDRNHFLVWYPVVINWDSARVGRAYQSTYLHVDNISPIDVLVTGYLEFYVSTIRDLMPGIAQSFCWSLLLRLPTALIIIILSRSKHTSRWWVVPLLQQNYPGNWL